MAESLDDAQRSSLFALRQFVRGAARATGETCDLCGEPIGTEHRHLLNLSDGQLLCACRACTILFDHQGAGTGTRRLVPTRYAQLVDFDMPDTLWEGLRIPVSMAFFTRRSDTGRAAAFYPGPAGPTQSLLMLEAWDEMERRNPALGEMRPDVEGLVVNRVRNAREYFIVPIDDCYKLVGLIRLHWKGLSGGQEVWQQIDRYFADLKKRSRPRTPRDA